MRTVPQNIFLLKNILRVGIQKSTVHVLIFRVFLATLIDECGTNKHYTLTTYRNGVFKQDDLIKPQ